MSEPSGSGGGGGGGGSPTPLSISYSPQPLHPGERATMSVAGGTAPYSYQLHSGLGVLSGNVYTAPTTAETAVVAVRDATGREATISIPVVEFTGANSLQYKAVLPAPNGGTLSCPSGTAESCVLQYSFVVPTYKTLRVRLWGGGGGDTSFRRGTDSEFLNLVAGAGAYPGIGGTARGGDININGYANGDAPFGGSAGKQSQSPTPPGGGSFGRAGFGGSGAYVMKTYRTGDLVPGAVVMIKVGIGASGSAYSPYAGGANGEVHINWD